MKFLIITYILNDLHELPGTGSKKYKMEKKNLTNSEGPWFVKPLP